MIKYKLNCKDCNLSFDSWFASSKEFEKLRKKNLLSCYKCNSTNVKKNIMAPSIIKSTKIISKNKDTKDLKKLKKTIKEYQKLIKDNFEYVGKNFAYEARSIHYNNKKKEKGIYGSASPDEIEELRDEGIETQIIPWVEDKNN